VNPRVDIVTVFHNDTNFRQHQELFEAIRKHEPDGGYSVTAIDNRENNRGFAVACNLGAFQAGATAPIVGFLNPDATVHGPFIDTVASTLDATVVITGCRFGKPQRELKLWGVKDWVCGAALFVSRSWFTDVGGFDEQFIWSHELDLIRRAESQGRHCRSIPLPINHHSPDIDTPEDAAYKQRHFQQAAYNYQRKWNRH
jgi:GT2 family glycosyltransferase